MCGIAGVADWRGGIAAQQAAFEAMQASLHRRGPDQKGIYMNDNIALIHSRLCVIDPIGGSQPMHLQWQGNEYILVYNGELYNTEDLRAQLLLAGHGFTGHSDTEVLLHAFAEWGEDCVGRFNGIFAFAIWDAAHKSLFFARDRMGVKPFFYYIEGRSFLFASEIKALLAHPYVQPEIDMRSIAEVMLIGPGRTPGYGVFRGIGELRPACCGRLDVGGMRTWRYWQLADRPHAETFADTVAHVRQLVQDAIDRQLVSDVRVGTFLSGGLDSSVISAVAGKCFREAGRKLQTFSVGYKDNEKYFQPGKFQPNSDDEYIRIMVARLQSEHHHISIDTGELVQALYDAVDARDLPGMADVDASMLLFCRQVKQHVKVALSGECADEIFGGYPWYRDRQLRERYGFPWAQSTDYRTGFLQPGLAAHIDAHEYVDERYQNTLADTSALPSLSDEEKRMRQMVRLNMDWFMQTLLERKDRMSMFSGLEVRVPFCDHRIAEYLYSVPWSMKDYNGQEKGLLRQAMRGLLPDEVLFRKKSPYPKTHNPAYLQAVSERLRDVINSPSSPLLDIVQKSSLERLLEDNRPTPWYGQLMTTPQTIAYFLQLDYWLRKYSIRLVS